MRLKGTPLGATAAGGMLRTGSAALRNTFSATDPDSAALETAQSMRAPGYVASQVSGCSSDLFADSLNDATKHPNLCPIIQRARQAGGVAAVDLSPFVAEPHDRVNRSRDLRPVGDRESLAQDRFNFLSIDHLRAR